MGPEVIAIVLIAGMLILLLMGLEVGWAVGIIGLIGLIWCVGQPVNQVAYTMWSSLNSFTLTAMPLFILMGAVLGNTGVNEYLFTAVDKWVGHFPGGLVISVLAGNAVFAAMSGSTMAATATFGKVAYPVMEKRGYDPSFALGSIAAGSVLAPIIPPSILLILYGAWQGLSVVDLLAAGVIPGFILTALYLTTAVVIVKIKPGLTPSPVKYSWSERSRALLGILPFVLLIGGVLGSVFGGLMTPTEAGGLGAALSIVLALFYRRLTFGLLRQSLLDTVKVTSFSLFIMAMSTLMSHVFNSAGIIPLVKEFVLGLHVGKYTILAGFFVMYLIMGCFFDSWSMLFLTFPFVMPVMIALGFNPIWWGVVYVMAAEQGTITPPFGLSLFVLRSVIPRHSISTIVKGALPYLIPIYINILLLILFPQLTLWLPGILGGK
ncbi:MAG: TRAP transporter large permease subunit [Thermodesulfobacteriota bacterium]